MLIFQGVSPIRKTQGPSYFPIDFTPQNHLRKEVFLWIEEEVEAPGWHLEQVSNLEGFLVTKISCNTIGPFIWILIYIYIMGTNISPRVTKKQRYNMCVFLFKMDVLFWTTTNLCSTIDRIAKVPKDDKHLLMFLWWMMAIDHIFHCGRLGLQCTN